MGGGMARGADRPADWTFVNSLTASLPETMGHLRKANGKGVATSAHTKPRPSRKPVQQAAFRENRTTSQGMRACVLVAISRPCDPYGSTKR
jgi:hypothetical protein